MISNNNITFQSPKSICLIGLYSADLNAYVNKFTNMLISVFMLNYKLLLTIIICS